MTNARLERSSPDRLLPLPAVQGLGRLRARLQRSGFTRHRHDTYTVALTLAGVQEFGYRGTVHRSLPGQVVVLHPDEAHDGRPGSSEGFAFESVYLEPARVPGLPFVRDPVLHDAALAAAIAEAFAAPIAPLQAEAITLRIARGLQRAAGRAASAVRRFDAAAVTRAADFLRANATRVVTAAELERACGLAHDSLYDQFRRVHGTSPHRFLLMRRLELVRARIAHGEALADIAAATGFADQAHMTRVFKAAFGFAPGAFARLRRA